VASVSKLIAGMTLSLDGFAADEDGDVSRLYEDLEDLHGTSYMDTMVAETGAVLMGRHAFEMAADPDWFVGNYEFQTPIVVLTHHPPERMPKQDEHLTFTFVDDLGRAVETAKAAAGDRAVMTVGGVSVIRQLLEARLVDEFRIDLVPLLLGSGLRLLGDLDPEVTLELEDQQRIGQRTSLRNRVTNG
jgi:dihydrofolate reductase